jgi:cytochrome c oxidase subunit 3
MATTSTTIPGMRRAEPARRRGLARHLERTGHKGIEPGLLGLMLFLASELMFFSGLFAAYWTFRADAPQWPLPGKDNKIFEVPSVPYATTLTIILVSSSLTIQGAIVAIKRGRQMAANGLITLTLVLGVIFISLQAREWAHLDFNIKEGIYPSLFYTITGFHGLHVIGGIVAITYLLWRSVAGALTPERHTMAEAVSLYWHFVDVVWVAVFSTLYVFGGAR